MLKTQMKQLITALTISAAMISAPVSVHAAEGAKAAKDNIAAGKKLAYSRSKGNCLACHMMDDGNLAGTIGPYIVAMKVRYPDKQKLYDKIWGTPDTIVPDSMMPPFGHNGVLTDDEIQKITDYVYSL